MFFSKPENFLSEYKIISQDKEETVVLGTFDQFKIMYEDMIINQKKSIPITHMIIFVKDIDLLGKLLNDKIS